MKIIKQGQSFLDKVTQFTGSFENALENAILNKVSITDDAIIGNSLVYGKITNKMVVQSIHPEREPATSAVYDDAVVLNDMGIGNMIIGSTFIIR
jgi:hypothetical protein